MNPQSAYLVDGVAINGVSGGPAFLPVGKRPYIVGVMSAYIPNRATGEALPGLCVISNVWQLHDVVQQLRNMGEARKTAEDAIVKQGAEGGR